jgi:hypothetical protein
MADTKDVNPGLRPGLGSIAPPALAVSCETAASANQDDLRLQDCV